jgi:predicted butyrate kinase (DUF1464 family)
VTARVLGIDPGTVSFDVCGRDGDRLFLDKTLPTREVSADPVVLMDVLHAAGEVDLIVGPSGYGLPWVDVRDLGPAEVDLLLLRDACDGPRGSIIAGMSGILEALRDSGLPMCFSPGVIHLASVPAHRKVNRIDMGTADKVCAVALAIWDQARRLAIPFEQTSFVSVEMGGAFTAVIAVEGGAIIDGSGGTAGALGHLSLGAMDGELAYLLRGFSKGTLASGGMAWIAGSPACSPEDLVAAAPTNPRAATALAAFLEEVVKRVAGEMTLLAAPREILVSGRLTRVPEILRELSRRLSQFAPVHVVRGFATISSEAAQGAALIGQGLVGGGSEELVEVMGLRTAGGSVLDHIYVDEAEAIRRRHLCSQPGPAPFWERG